MSEETAEELYFRATGKKWEDFVKESDDRIARLPHSLGKASPEWKRERCMVSGCGRLVESLGDRDGMDLLQCNHCNLTYTLPKE